MGRGETLENAGPFTLIHSGQICMHVQLQLKDLKPLF